jgi:hypothetical protein
VCTYILSKAITSVGIASETSQGLAAVTTSATPDSAMALIDVITISSTACVPLILQQMKIDVGTMTG